MPTIAGVSTVLCGWMYSGGSQKAERATVVNSMNEINNSSKELMPLKPADDISSAMKDIKNNNKSWMQDAVYIAVNPESQVTPSVLPASGMSWQKIGMMAGLGMFALGGCAATWSLSSPATSTSLAHQPALFSPSGSQPLKATSAAPPVKTLPKSGRSHYFASRQGRVDFGFRRGFSMKKSAYHLVGRKIANDPNNTRTLNRAKIDIQAFRKVSDQLKEIEHLRRG